MTSEGLGEMFEGDSADTCAEKFPLVSMGGRVEGLACTGPGARTPIGASGNLYIESGKLYKIIEKNGFCPNNLFLLRGLFTNRILARQKNHNLNPDMTGKGADKPQVHPDNPSRGGWRGQCRSGVAQCQCD